jgi:hypothetical protein
LALAESKPIQVDIEDVGIAPPSILEDEWPGGHTGSTHSTLSIIIPIVRFIGQLKKTLKSRVISRATIKSYDDYFRAILGTYPEQYQDHSETYLDPFCLHAIIPLHLARFHLYRHNLNSHSSHQERTEAIDRCVSVALETVRYFSRTMHTPVSVEASAHSTQNWRDPLLAAMDNTICRHLWRCSLILCFRGEYHAALTCLRVSRIVNDTRKMNIACGRNLAFFLDKLTERSHGGTVALRELETDFELLAYVTGDLQGDIYNAFVWNTSEPSYPRSTVQSPNDPAPLSMPFSDEDVPASALLTDKEMKDWGGWDRVERQIGTLLAEQQRQLHMQHQQSAQQQQPLPPPIYHRPAHNETKRLQLAPLEAAPRTTTASTPPAGASRISIANII